MATVFTNTNNHLQNLTQQQLQDLYANQAVINGYAGTTTTPGYVTGTATTYYSPVEARLDRIEKLLAELLKEKIALKRLKS